MNQRPGHKIKRYLNKKQKNVYDNLLLHQNKAKGVNQNEYYERKTKSDKYYKSMKQKKWNETTSHSINSNNYFKLFNSINKAGKI
jgi:hypothetical protein